MIGVNTKDVNVHERRPLCLSYVTTTGIDDVLKITIRIYYLGKGINVQLEVLGQLKL